MFDISFIEDIVRRLGDSVPPDLQKFKHDLEKNFRAVLQSMFSKLDLVTREEFNVQQGVLTKTRAKISVLEKQIAQLEKSIHKKTVKKKGL